ncbi:FUSC family protein [Bdellovibrio svalbardensis]|uniref:FUSC family protein n=1 Tax=Bdellovibrio svalbardensis TaxID=2972972 RepID=A0ABT6DKH2_9BACT|nr:FUSC family protein [Bdellovibrio svalbardensis]MDG0816409.1 FUSC family protein [Bdellovibrio svalbardensis]
MGKMSGFWAQLGRFEKNKMEPWLGFRAALGMALSVGIGFLVGSPKIGLSIAIGALNVCFSDRSDAYLDRAKRMLTASVLSAVAVFISVLSAHDSTLMFIFLTVGAFFAGMLVVVDAIAADLGVMGLATFLIFSVQPLSPEAALYLSLYAFLGGILQSIVSVGLWPLRRYKPECRALSNLFQDLAFLTVSTGQAKDTPMGSLQTIETQNALVALAGDDRTEARRYRSLLSQAERLRITILSLIRLKKRLQRENPQHLSIESVARILETTAQILRAVSEVVVSGQPLGVGPKLLAQVDDSSQAVKLQRLDSETPFMTAVLNDLVYQLEGLGGQLRATVDLSLKTTQVGIEKAERLEASRPLKMRFRGTLATLRANMTFQSPGFRHAIRLTVCIVIGELVSHSLHLSRAYWVPMTIAIVLKPDYASTFSRGLLRMAGTLVGLVLATVLFHILPDNPWVSVSLIVFFSFLIRWIGPTNYGIFAMSMAALVVLLIALTGVAPKDVIWARGINTFLGGVIALVVYWLWPTSEKLQLSEVVARMLETYHEYFKAIASSVRKKSVRSDAEMDSLRQKARVARFNFQAASGRISLERGVTFEDLKIISAVTVASNRFAHAMMAVEAGSSLQFSEDQLRAFDVFAESVEESLTLLCEALRGREVLRNQFPDVRGAYVQFAETQKKASEQYAILFEETDRMTNSLVTLTEQVLKRLFNKRFQSSNEVKTVEP